MLIFPIILYQFQKDPFYFTILYEILFYFIHGQEETTLGDNFFITLITGCMFQKIALLSDFMHIFHDFIHRQGQTTHKGQNFDVNR